MSNVTPLLLFPYNGNALEALDCLADNWRCIGIVDDAVEKKGMHFNGVEVFDRTAFSRWPDAMVLAVPGGPQSFKHRKAVIEALAIQENRYAQVIHPAASVSPQTKIGHNTLIMSGVVLTSNAVIGSHCCILPNTVVHHDSQIGDWTLIGANATVCGGTSVGENCYIGAASSVMNGVEIGSGAMIGFGANVIRDVDPGSCVVGNPARVL